MKLIEHPFETRIRSRIMSLAWSVGSSFVSALLVATIVMTGLAQSVSAATLTYQASVSPISVTLSPGQTKTITIKFTNTGSATWIGSKANTALYLYGDSTVFGSPTWLKDDMPAVIEPVLVKPGQIGSATFVIKAPVKAGIYHERFLLSYGTNLWMKGSTVAATFTVTGSATASSVTTIPSTTATAASAPIQSNSDVWKAELSDAGGIEWQTDPGGHLMMNIAFKNRGTHAWTNEGGLPLWLLTSAKRTSSFKDFSWTNSIQVAKLKETLVRPGEIGHFTVELRAPAVPGDYKESFQLSAGTNGENWLNGGIVNFPIHITMPNEYIAKGINGQTGNYQAMLLLKPSAQATLSGNGRIQLSYGFKNAGTATWNSLSLRVSGVEAAMSGSFSVRDDSWVDASKPVDVNSVTAPGQIGFVTFTIKAPPKKGSYTAHFALYADNQKVEDGFIDIPITVTADGYIAPEPTPVPTSNPSPTPSTPGTALTVQPLGGDTSALPNEPMIRVGLFATTDDTMVVRAVSGGFTLQQNGQTVCTFNAGDSVTVHYDRVNKVSKATGPNCTSQSSGVFVTVPNDPIGPMELTDFSRPVSWLPGANDNKFRGKLELRYTPATDAVWIINELPVEWYLKGSGETSNSSPPEYQRALLTAARTYAMYHVNRGTKHADENYIVDATYDQVYRGYGAEIRNPVVVQAINDTRGQIVTYQGKLAITPYYSRSDGRTRGWTEVWGGSGYPWLVSVQVPWDIGRVLWGHGVGMSATGAIGMANAGKGYQEILKWFYTGVDIMQAYK